MAAGLLFTNVFMFTWSFLRTPIAQELRSDWVKVHAVAFAGWLVLFLAQTLLAARGRLDLHRRLGFHGALLAALMILLTLMSGYGMWVESATRPLLDRVMLSSVVHVDMVIFTAFLAAGVRCRERRPDWHKRMMLLCTIVVGMRFPIVDKFLPWAVPHYVDQSLLIGVAMLFDRVAHGRVHRAYFVGVAVILSLAIAADWSFRLLVPHLVVQSAG